MRAAARTQTETESERRGHLRACYRHRAVSVSCQRHRQQLVHKETGSDGKDSFRLNLDSAKMIEVTGIVCDLLNDKHFPSL